MRMKWIPCNVIVDFVCNVRKYKRGPILIYDLKNKDELTHGDVNPIHLRDHQKGEIDEVVKKNLSIKLTAAVTGITKSTFKVARAIMDINYIYANIDRAKYEIKRHYENAHSMSLTGRNHYFKGQNTFKNYLYVEQRKLAGEFYISCTDCGFATKEKSDMLTHIFEKHTSTRVSSAKDKGTNARTGAENSNVMPTPL